MYTQEDMSSLRYAFLTKYNKDKHWLFKDKQQFIHMFGEVKPTTSCGSKAILEALFHNELLQMNLNDSLVRPLIDLLGETQLENYSWKILIPVKITKVAWIALNIVCSKSGAAIIIYDPSDSLANNKQRYEDIIKGKFSRLYPNAAISCHTYKGEFSDGLFTTIEEKVSYSGPLIFALISSMFQGHNINPSFSGLTADIMAKLVAMQKTLKYKPDNKKLTFIVGDNNNPEDDSLSNNNYLVYSGDTKNRIPHGNGTLFFCNAMLRAKAPIISGYFDNGKIPQNHDVNSYHTKFRDSITNKYKVSIRDILKYFNETYKALNQDVNILNILGFNIAINGYAEPTEKYILSDTEQEEIDELTYTKNSQRIRMRKIM